MGIMDQSDIECLPPDFFFDPETGGCKSCKELCPREFEDLQRPCRTYCKELYEFMRIAVQQKQPDAIGDGSMTAMEGHSAATTVMVALGILGAFLLIACFIWWRKSSTRKHNVPKDTATSYIRGKCFGFMSCSNQKEFGNNRTPIYVGERARINQHALGEASDVGVPMMPSRKHTQIQTLEGHCMPSSQYLTSITWSPDGQTSTSLGAPVYMPCVQTITDGKSPAISSRLNDIFEDISLH